MRTGTYPTPDAAYKETLGPSIRRFVISPFGWRSVFECPVLDFGVCVVVFVVFSGTCEVNRFISFFEIIVEEML